MQRGFSDYDITFPEIPSHVDNTSKPVQGCTMVLAWLRQSPGARQRYFGGLFDSSPERCDAIIVHLDADNLSEVAFRKHVLNHDGMNVKNPKVPDRRGAEIRRIIRAIGKLGLGYVIATAVESTETWCLASFRDNLGSPERLSGPSLIQQFMDAMHEFEKRPTQIAKKPTKDRMRWERFCRHQLRTKAERIELQCPQYRMLVEDLVGVLNNPS